MPFIPKIHTLQDEIFNFTVYMTWLLYIAIALGLSANAPEYLDTLQYYVKIYISLFLIWRFNPFRRVRFTSLDAKIAFSAGLFLIATTAINSILSNYLKELKNYLDILKFN